MNEPLKPAVVVPDPNAAPDPNKPAVVPDPNLTATDPNKPAVVPDPAAVKPTEPPKWEPYELEAPKDVELDAELFKGFKSLLEKHKIPKEAAADILGLQATRIKELYAAAEAESAKTYEKWDKEVKAIPDSPAVVAAVKDLIAKSGDAEVQNIFAQSDLLKNPGIVKWLGAIAKRLSPDTMPDAGTRIQPRATEPPKSAETQMYGGSVVVPVPRTT